MENLRWTRYRRVGNAWIGEDCSVDEISETSLKVATNDLAAVKIQEWWRIMQFCTDIENDEQRTHRVDMCYCPLCDEDNAVGWAFLDARPKLLMRLGIDYDYYYNKWEEQREGQWEFEARRAQVKRRNRLWMRTLWRMEWTAEEDAELQNQMKNWEGHSMYRQTWEEVADAIGTKDHMECQYHWETLQPDWKDSVGAAILKKADDDYFFAEREQTIQKFQEGQMAEVITKCDELLGLTRRPYYREELQELRTNAVLANCSGFGNLGCAI